MTSGPTVYIDQNAIRHNLRHIQSLCGMARTQATPKTWAVVKSDAYGHGLQYTLPALHNADGLAVLNLDEAHTCRKLGWQKPILLLSADTITTDLIDPKLFPLHLLIDTPGQITALEQLPHSASLHIWLRYTGQLHHAGIQTSDYLPAYQRAAQMLVTGQLAGLGHFQHYANADRPQALAQERQHFLQLTAGLPGLFCTENSASILTTPEYAADTSWLRSGIALYGISPLANMHGHDLGLQAAMTLQASIYGVQHLQAGDTLGYGGIFRANHTMRAGLVHCGYADGYPRNLKKNTLCWINGKPARLIGQVSMNTLSVDITDHPEAGPGSKVTLWGRNGPCIEAIAQAADTIPAQLCTALTAQVVRQAVGQASERQ